MITSLQNSTIKEVIKLSKSAERKQQQLCVVEGNREVSIAQQFGFDFVDIFVCHDIFKTDEEYPINFEGNFQMIEVSKEVYAKMSYRNGTEGIMAVIKTNENKVRNFEPNENSLVLVLESIEKPGNIGAMLRTADATKVDAVILCNAFTDVFNPNAIRSSLGCVFAVPILMMCRTHWNQIFWNIIISVLIIMMYGHYILFSTNYTLFFMMSKTQCSIVFYVIICYSF